MKQEDQFYRIVALMSAMAESDITEDQALELASLLDTVALRRMFRAVDNGKEVVQGLARYAPYPYREAFRRFQQRVGIYRRRRYLRFAMAGAAAVLLLFASVVGWRLVNQAPVTDSGLIKPATKQAVLMVGAESRFELSERDTTIRAQHANVTISNGEIRFDAPDDDSTVAESVIQNQIFVPYGGIYTVWLVDGTKVVLNSHSELSFPSLFAPHERVVALKGEGYFEVAEERSRCFTVHTDDSLTIRVLGTKFNVQAYDDIPESYVTLLEGSVGVRHLQTDVVLKPNEQAVFDRSSESFLVRSVTDAANTITWTNGYFDFEAAPFSTIIKSLEKWYNVHIVTDGLVADHLDIDELGIFCVRMSYRGDITQILDLLCEITGLKYRIDDRTVHLFF